MFTRRADFEGHFSPLYRDKRDMTVLHNCLLRDNHAHWNRSKNNLAHKRVVLSVQYENYTLLVMGPWFGAFLSLPALLTWFSLKKLLKVESSWVILILSKHQIRHHLKKSTNTTMKGIYYKILPPDEGQKRFGFCTACKGRFTYDSSIIIFCVHLKKLNTLLLTGV